MHDRRIDGIPHTFGNAGTLFMNAMTWWDHETDSMWSQPWGRSIRGPLKGVELKLLPFQLTTWANWRSDHPETLVMSTDADRLGPLRQGFKPNFVIGLVLGDNAKAYYFMDVQQAGVVNDWIGSFPVVIWAADENYHAFVRQVDDQVLDFQLQEGTFVDEQTGSKWDLRRGLALEGPLQGKSLQAVPGFSAFDWAFEDFYPESEFYTP